MELPPDGTLRHRRAAESASLRQEWLVREPKPKAKAPPCRPLMPTSAGRVETAQEVVTLQTLPPGGDDSRRPASQSEDEDESGTDGAGSSPSCDNDGTQGAEEGPGDFSCWLAFPKRLELPWLEKRRAHDLWVPGHPKLPWPPLDSFLERTPATWRGDDLEPIPTPTWSKWRWAFVCGLGQRADLNGVLGTVSLVDILADLQKPEDRCRVSPLPANYLQTLTFTYDDVGCSSHDQCSRSQMRSGSGGRTSGSSPSRAGGSRWSMSCTARIQKRTGLAHSPGAELAGIRNSSMRRAGDSLDGLL